MHLPRECLFYLERAREVVTDPNVTYKLAFAQLRERLGRMPTANELIPLHDAFKASYSEARDIRVAAERANAAAGRPEPTRPSRQPAPQARSGDTREGWREVAPGVLARDEVGSLATGGPRIIPTREEAESAPSPSCAPSRDYHGLIEGDRGPGGGLMGVCTSCGQLWERPARKGRPAYRCEPCRS